LQSSLFTPPGNAVVTLFCCVACGCGAVQFEDDDVDDLRRRSFHGCEQTQRNAALKHADPQTLAALLAVEQAARSCGLDRSALADWGVIASPRTPGRPVIAGALTKFAREGAWSVSPHLVPHYSLHSTSGTISQLWHMHGPNLGVGGFAGNEPQAMLVAAAILRDGGVPGLWVVWTGWEPEPTPGNSPSNSVCRAVALALVPAETTQTGAHVRLTAPAEGAAFPDQTEMAPSFTLEALHARLSASRTPTGTWRWMLGPGRWLEMAWDGQAREAAA
jgi:hypothetical protein